MSNPTKQDLATEEYLTSRYKLVKREYWNALCIVAALLPVLCGLGAWQIARETGKAVVQGTAAQQASDRIKQLEAQAETDAKSIRDKASQWQGSGAEARLVGLESTVATLRSELTTKNQEVKDLQAQALQDAEYFADLAADLNITVAKLANDLSPSDKRVWDKVVRDMPKFQQTTISRRDEVKKKYAPPK